MSKTASPSRSTPLLRRYAFITLSVVLSITLLFIALDVIADSPVSVQAQLPHRSHTMSDNDAAMPTPPATATPDTVGRQTGTALSPDASTLEMLGATPGTSIGDYVITTTVEIAVAAASDDAGINAGGGSCAEGLYAWEVYVGWCDYGVQPVTTGVRFQGVTIPEGATLVDAYLWVQVEPFSRDIPRTRIYGEATIDSATFSTEDPPSSRMTAKTANYVLWDTATQWDGQQLFYSSPSLLPIVQEVLALAGWQSGNALTLLLVPDSDVTVGDNPVYTLTDVHHRFRSWDFADNDNEYAPRLFLTYTETRWTDPALSHLVAAPQTTVADGAHAISVTVTLSDTYGPLVAKSVVLSATASLSTTWPAGNQTDASGAVVAALTSVVPQTATLTAFVVEDSIALDQTAVITFTEALSSSWQAISTAHVPDASREYGLAYDSGRDVVVLYGGNDGWPYENSTWEFDGNDWTVVTTTQQPEAVYGMGLAYDGNQGAIILFGGSDNDDDALAQTWEYDGNNWSLLSPTTSPPARSYTALAYDPDTQVVYLFGGNDGQSYYNDLWRYDGTTWTQINTPQAPSARALHALAYHEGEGNLYLFGGRAANGTQLADLWAFDPSSSTWSAIGATGPVARQAHSFAYNAARELLVLAAGVGDAGDTLWDDTWHYQSGIGWIEVTPALLPPPSAYHTAVYEPSEQAILLFTGGQTWRYR